MPEGILKDSPEKATQVAEELTNVANQKAHARRIHAQDLKNMGLVIKDLKENDDLQEAVLSVHHAFMIALSNCYRGYESLRVTPALEPSPAD